MDKVTIPTGESPHISLHARGNLRLTGWGQAQVQVNGPLDTAPAYDSDRQTLSLDCTGDCVIQVPVRSAVQVESVDGNADLRNLEGELTVGQVGANLSLHQATTPRVGTVRGNLSAEKIHAGLSVTKVFGNATLRAIDGQLLVADAIHGRLVLSEAGGALVTVDGDATLQLRPAPGGEYRIVSRGSLFCELSQDASATVSLSSKGRAILIDLPGLSKSLNEKQHTFTLGNGDAILDLSASGQIYLSGEALAGVTWDEADLEFDEQFTGMATEISQQIELQMETLERQLNDRLSHLAEAAGTAGLASEEIDSIVQQARAASQRAAMRAQIKAQAAAQRAQEKLARKLEKARRETQRKARAAARRSPDTAAMRRYNLQPDLPSQEVSEPEMLMILQMLEQRKITVEEANRLLEALEGKHG